MIFTHVNGCAVTQTSFADIKLKGILYPYDLKDLDEEDLVNTLTNMCCPPPMVTTVVGVLVQDINVSAKS